MKCPNCELENPASATVCQCGYDFSEGEVSNSRVDSDVQVDIEEVHSPKGVKKTLFIASGILLIVFGGFFVFEGGILYILGGVLLLGKAFRKAQVTGWNEGQKYRFIKAPGNIAGKILLINLLVLFSQVVFGPTLIELFALTPNQLFKGYIWQLLTYFFLHGNFSHFLGNAVLLWQLGSDVEEKMGRRSFLMFYIICGVGSGLFYTLLYPFVALGTTFRTIGSVGSDGCISGIIVAYLFLFPNRYVFDRWIKFKFICPLLLLVGLSPLLSLGGGGFHWMGGMLTGAIFMFIVSSRFQDLLRRINLGR